MRTLVLPVALVALLVLLIAGCSGDDPPSAAPAPSVATGATLEETCPQVERALQGLDVDSAASRHEAARRVRGLAAGGDWESEVALTALVRGLQRPGTWMATLGRLASTCAAAGAPVFR